MNNIVISICPCMHTCKSERERDSIVTSLVFGPGERKNAPGLLLHGHRLCTQTTHGNMLTLHCACIQDLYTRGYVRSVGSLIAVSPKEAKGIDLDRGREGIHFLLCFRTLGREKERELCQRPIIAIATEAFSLSLSPSSVAFMHTYTSFRPTKCLYTLTHSRECMWE